MKIKKLALALICSATLGAATLAAQAADKISIAVSTLPSALYLPLYAADVMGYFQKNDIDMKIVKLKDGTTALAAAVTGGTNFYMGATGSIIRAAEKGTGATIVATTQVGYPINLVMRRDVAEKKNITEKSSIEERIQALKGLKIGVTGPGSGTDQLVHYLLDQGKIDPRSESSIAFVGSGSAMVAAIQAGNVDVLAASDPTSDKAVENADCIWLFNVAAGELPSLKNFPFMALMATSSWANSNEDLTRRTVASIQQGSQSISGDEETSDKVRDLVYEKYFTGTDEATFKTIWKTVKGTFPQSVASSLTSMKDAIAFLDKFSDESYSIDPAKTFTNDFVAPADKTQAAN